MGMNVLFFTDHPLAKSGVARMSRNVVELGDHDYEVVPRQSVQGETTFAELGTAGVRQKLQEEDPDILLLFGSRGLFRHVFDSEHEIRSQHCPVAWYHVWDNKPAPEWNQVFYDSCDTVFTASALTRDLVGSIGTSAEIKHVPHGVREDRFYPESDLQYFEELEGADFVVTYVGRNQRRKNLVTLLRAFSETEDSVLALRTEPDGAHVLPEVAQHLGIQDRTYFYPEMPNEMLRALYNRSDVVVNPAYREGFGLPTLEAGFCGCKRLSASTGGLREQIRELSGHYVVPSNRSFTGEQSCPVIAEDRLDHKALSDMIEGTGAPDRKSISESVRSESQYTAQSMVEALEQGLEETAQNAQKPNRYYIDEV